MIDPYPVTNTQFAAFVDNTGYVTEAERVPDPALYPGAPPENLVPGALVFVMPPVRVHLGDFTQWWAWTPGADWRHPTGPESSNSDMAEHPVVKVIKDGSDTVGYEVVVPQVLLRPQVASLRVQWIDFYR